MKVIKGIVAGTLLTLVSSAYAANDGIDGRCADYAAFLINEARANPQMAIQGMFISQMSKRYAKCINELFRSKIGGRYHLIEEDGGYRLIEYF